MNDMNGSPDFSSLSSIGPSARTSWASQGDFQVSCSLVAAIVVGMYGRSNFFFLISLVRNIYLVAMGVWGRNVHLFILGMCSHVAIFR